jgi:hypothetical protein
MFGLQLQIARNLAAQGGCLAYSLSSIFLCSLLAPPLSANAEQPAAKARQTQRQVAAIDANFKARNPLLERALEEGESG